MSHNHYFRDVSGLERVDVYRLLDLFGVTCPVAQHVVKKAIAAGQRGHKTLRRDWQDIADSAARKLQMIDEDNGWTPAAIKSAAFLVKPQSDEEVRKAMRAQEAAEGMPQHWPDETRRQDAAAEDEAFAAIEASKPRIDSGPMWVEWRGADKAPCNPGMAVEVRFRNGQVVTAQARELIWDQDGSACDIVAWRDPWPESAEKSGIPNFPRKAVGADVAFPTERGLYFAPVAAECDEA